MVWVWFLYVLVSIWHNHSCFLSPARFPFPTMTCAPTRIRVGAGSSLQIICLYACILKQTWSTWRAQRMVIHHPSSNLSWATERAQSLVALVGTSCLSGVLLLGVAWKWSLCCRLGVCWHEDGVEGSACCLPAAACQKHCSSALPLPGLRGKGNQLLNIPARCWNVLILVGGEAHHRLNW